MSIDGLSGEGASLRHYLTVARRRKWIILQALVLMPAAALVLSLRQQPMYRGFAEVVITGQDAAAAVTGLGSSSGPQPSDRSTETQAALARVPELARRVLRAAGLDSRSAAALLRKSSVSAKPDVDLLQFRVDDRSAQLARWLASEYARQFTIYRRQLDVRVLESARLKVEARAAELAAAGQRGSALYRDLLETERKLGTAEALGTSSGYVVQPADRAARIEPRPARSLVLGLGVGLLFGLGLAFLREALDTRVRSADEISARLGIPLLGFLPPPPRSLGGSGLLAMVATPHHASAEAFRQLRTSLAFANLKRRARTIVVTSATEDEGKSTTVANLAVALARAGQRVVLVDLDLRRPTLDRAFAVERSPGLTDVVLEHATLAEALVPVPIDSGRAGRRASLELLPAGTVPLDPGELVASDELADLLAKLRERADLVLVDTPPLLQVGDAMTVSAKVDALVVVTRLNELRRPSLAGLKRLLDAAPAAKLGFVVTGAGAETDYAYGGYGAGAYGTPGGSAAQKAVAEAAS